jgi:hypothetical protein
MSLRQAGLRQAGINGLMKQQWHESSDPFREADRLCRQSITLAVAILIAVSQFMNRSG